MFAFWLGNIELLICYNIMTDDQWHLLELQEVQLKPKSCRTAQDATSYMFYVSRIPVNNIIYIGMCIGFFPRSCYTVPRCI